MEQLFDIDGSINILYLDWKVGYEFMAQTFFSLGPGPSLSNL